MWACICYKDKLSVLCVLSISAPCMCPQKPGARNHCCPMYCPQPCLPLPAASCCRRGGLAVARVGMVAMLQRESSRAMCGLQSLMSAQPCPSCLAPLRIARAAVCAVGCECADRQASSGAAAATLMDHQGALIRLSLPLMMCSSPCCRSHSHSTISEMMST